MGDHTRAVLTCDGDQATVSFRTEAGINVGSVPFMHELETAVDALAADRAVRFAVFRGEGKVFLAGADIKAMSEYDMDAARDMAQLGHRVLNKLSALPQITVASLHGAALGGGSELALACDFRVASADTKIGQPEVLLGLIPGWGGTQRLPRLVPRGVARQLLFSGETIDGRRALEIGWIDAVVDKPAELEPRIAALLAGFGKAGPTAIAGLKRALQSGDEIESFAALFGGDESKEGLRAFLERRPASWVRPS
jgi:enoyl-CoA hydratase